MLHTPKRHAVYKIFTENKLFYFSKRALRAGTECNKWLKEVLLSEQLRQYCCSISQTQKHWFLYILFTLHKK